LGSISFGVKDNGFQTILLPFYNLVICTCRRSWWAGHFHRACGRCLPRSHRGQHLRQSAHALGTAASADVSVRAAGRGQLSAAVESAALVPHALFLYLIVVAIVVRTFITFYEIPSSALVPELTEDYDERTSFVGYRVFFGLVWRTDDVGAGLSRVHARRRDAQGRSAQSPRLQPLRSDGRHRDVRRDPGFGGRNAPLHSLFPQTAARRITLMQYAREMFATLNNRRF
jgi:hypothetical protein